MAQQRGMGAWHNVDCAKHSCAHCQGATPLPPSPFSFQALKHWRPVTGRQ